MKNMSIMTGILTLTAMIVTIAGSGVSAAAGESSSGGMLREYITEDNMPVGGWEPAEIIRIDEDVEINVNSGVLRSSRSVINSDPDSAFTKGVGSVGYNSLNEAQRSVYASINTAALQFHYATEDLQPTLMTISGRGEEFYYIAARIDYADHGLTTNEMYQTFIAYDYDHPAYYWIANQTLCSDREFFICTCAEYASAAERSRINNLIENGVRKYAAVADKCGLTLDKITAIHDMVVTDVDYAYKSDGTTPEGAKWAHSVQGVFDRTHSHVVCEGYADVFSLMMNYLGIPNYYIVGTASGGGAGSGGGHAWNAVSDDGGLTYMYMDR
ncbi:MAG: transglutaminase-like domain-containing protein, partial [Lachnospiraceae bacterium]|nr:transglutaminase-like domain-containing protein [Lachnospiraceae bacterium]